MGVEVGQQAPNFSLLNTERQPVTLELLRGKPVILAFFPLAFSPVCTGGDVHIPRCVGRTERRQRPGCRRSASTAPSPCARLRRRKD